MHFLGYIPVIDRTARSFDKNFWVSVVVFFDIPTSVERLFMAFEPVNLSLVGLLKQRRRVFEYPGTF